MVAVVPLNSRQKSSMAYSHQIRIAPSAESAVIGTAIVLRSSFMLFRPSSPLRHERGLSYTRGIVASQATTLQSVAHDMVAVCYATTEHHGRLNTHIRLLRCNSVLYFGHTEPTDRDCAGEI